MKKAIKKILEIFMLDNHQKIGKVVVSNRF